MEVWEAFVFGFSVGVTGMVLAISAILRLVDRRYSRR